MSPALGLQAAATIPTEPTDRDRLLELLRALEAKGEAHVLTIAGEPKPKPRPRFGQGRAYAGRTQTIAERTVAIALRSAFPHPLEGNVALAALFYRPTRRRVDDDNLAKLVRDAANGIVFADDCQVTGACQVLELDREAPRTVLAIAGHRSSLLR